MIITDETGDHALVKTDDEKTMYAIGMLCKSHLVKVKPEAKFFPSLDRHVNAMIGMHPDKQWIIDKMRGHEFPLPKDSIQIDGEVNHEKKAT